jgi:hypothetical protein
MLLYIEFDIIDKVCQKITEKEAMRGRKADPTWRKRFFFEKEKGV